MRTVRHSILITCVVVCCSFLFAADKVLDTTISDLTLYPRRFDRNLVRVHGLLVFGERGAKFLLDPHPADSALLSMNARVGFFGKSRSGTVCDGIPSRAGRVYGTFTGRFHYAPWNSLRDGSQDAFRFEVINVSELHEWTGFGEYALQVLLPRFPADLNDLQIRVVHTMCFGRCPDYSVTIFGNGVVAYDGRGFVKVHGKLEKTIEPDLVGDLVHKFFAAGFFSAMSGYGNCYGDVPSTSISIDWPGGHKSVNYCRGKGLTISAPVLQLEDTIERTAGVREWVGIGGPSQMN